MPTMSHGQRGGSEKMTATQAIAQLKAKMRRSSHQVRGVFNNFDTDHDQMVSRAQFSRCLDRLGIHCELAEVRIELCHHQRQLLQRLGRRQGVGTCAARAAARYGVERSGADERRRRTRRWRRSGRSR